MPALVVPARDVQFESEFGGAFFLLNAFDDLDLFAVSLSANDAPLSVWEMVRRFVISVIGRDFERDPLSPFLERLTPIADWPWVDASESVLIPVFERVRNQIEALIDADDAPALLLRQRGKVVRRETRIEVEFSLDRHPIEIRAARLDRNPGWVAVAATYVSFVFSSGRVGVMPDAAQPSRRR